jgi:hypothetical protein
LLPVDGEGAPERLFVLELADGEIGVPAEAFQVLGLRRLEVGLLEAADREDEDLQAESLGQE